MTANSTETSAPATSSHNQHKKKGSSRPTRPYWAWTVSTFFGAGMGKPGPGTWGSAAAVLSWWFIAHALPPQWLTAGALTYCAVATAIGIPAATLTARSCGREDPSHVVIDEVAGVMLTLAGAPLTWQAQLAGFVLFRVFDILKPPPIRMLERLRPEGVGIMLDDLGAGVYGWIVLQILLHAHLIH